MKLWDFLTNFGSKKQKKKIVTYASQISQQIQVNELAFQACVNIVVNLASKCELKVIKDGKTVKNDEWYRWNIQPNPNQNATQFLQKLLYNLYTDNEALIVPRLNGELYVADSFTRDDSQAFNLHTYSNIKIDGYLYPPILKEDQVFYFKLNNTDIKQLVDGVAGLYAEMMNAFQQFYKNSVGMKLLLHIDTVAEQDSELLDDLINEQFVTFFEAVNAVQPLFSGYNVELLSNSTTPGIDTRDFTAQVKDVFELYASAFNIPEYLVTSEVQDTSKAVDDLLTFCLDPLFELISDELNRKLFDKDKYLRDNYVKFQTNNIKHVDVFDISSNVEKLISSGFCCIDDARELCGLDRLKTDWSTQFFITKNFSSIDESLKSIERGDPIETGDFKQTTSGDARAKYSNSKDGWWWDSEADSIRRNTA